MSGWPSSKKIIRYLTGKWKTSTEVAGYFGFTRAQPGRPVDVIESKLRYLVRKGDLIRREIPQDRNRPGSRCRFEYSAKVSDMKLESFIKEETEEEKRIRELKKNWQTFCGEVEYIGLKHIRFRKTSGVKISLKTSDEIKDYVLMNELDCGKVKVWHKSGVLKWVEKACIV